MLVLENIVKKIGGRVVLKDINAEFQGGMNFILGPSGSGKSTLLKIIGGMDKKFDGEVIYKENSLKTFNEDELNNYHYNSIGFIWQNFQLLNHLTVEENVKVVLELSNLSNKDKDKKVKKILYTLKIDKLSDHKVANLSGGQKQRVAIARALVKNPEIIIADEPTGSLDKESSKIIIDVLRIIAKEKLVIVVTHDKSLVKNEDACFYLKDGIIEKVQEGEKTKNSIVKKQKTKPHLSLSNAINQSIRNFKGMTFKFILTAIILAVSTCLLVLNIGGSVAGNQSKIMTTFGQEVSDDELRLISVFGDYEHKGDEVEKNIFSIGDKYDNDPRVEYLVWNYLISEPEVYAEGKNIIEDSNNSGKGSSGFVKMEGGEGINLVAGRMPKSGKKEIVIPKGIKNAEDLIGKNISVKGKVIKEFATGNSSAVFKDIEINDVEVVGVTEDSGKSLYLTDLDMYKDFYEKYKTKVGMFAIKVKEKTDVLAIVNELDENAGIFTSGSFKFLEDTSVLEEKTQEQSSSVLTIILILAAAGTLIITIINAHLRKLEFAILKINGYSKGGLLKLSIIEYGIISIIAIPIVIASLLVMGVKNIPLSILMLFFLGTIMGIISGIISAKTNVVANIKTGDQK